MFPIPFLAIQLKVRQIEASASMNTDFQVLLQIFCCTTVSTLTEPSTCFHLNHFIVSLVVWKLNLSSSCNSSGFHPGLSFFFLALSSSSSNLSSFHVTAKENHPQTIMLPPLFHWERGFNMPRCHKSWIWGVHNRCPDNVGLFSD